MSTLAIPMCKTKLNTQQGAGNVLSSSVIWPGISDAFHETLCISIEAACISYIYGSISVGRLLCCR